MVRSGAFYRLRKNRQHLFVSFLQKVVYDRSSYFFLLQLLYIANALTVNERILARGATLPDSDCFPFRYLGKKDERAKKETHHYDCSNC